MSLIISPLILFRHKRRREIVNRLIVILGVALIAAGPAPAKDLATYKATYERKLAEITLSHGVVTSGLDRQYEKALAGLLAKVKKAGDLDETKAVMSEIARFGNQKAIPSQPSELLDIQKLQSHYTRLRAPHEGNKAKNIITLTTQYDQVLERLQRSLVSSDKLDEATAVQKERGRLQETAVYNAAETFLSKPAPQSNPTRRTAAHAPKRPSTGSMPGLVLWYSFDKLVRSRVQDGSTCKNHGKNHGGTPVADGRINGAILLDGKNDYISIADRLSIGENNTVSVWVKVPPAGQADLEHGERVGIILGNNASGTPPYANWEIWGNGRMGAWWNAGEKSLGPPPDLRDDRWHHLAWIKDKNTDTFTAYVDGELVATLDGAGADLRFKSKHRVGADNRTGTMPFFHGMLDELMIFDRALSLEELGTLAQPK
jgi:hypothetical protein